jgi:hypothetical protein
MAVDSAVVTLSGFLAAGGLAAVSYALLSVPRIIESFTVHRVSLKVTKADPAQGLEVLKIVAARRGSSALSDVALTPRDPTTGEPGDGCATNVPSRPT